MKLLVLCLVITVHCKFSFGDASVFNPSFCSLPISLVNEIQSYSTFVENLINIVKYGPFKWQLYNELAAFTDEFGPRISGSTNLENSINFLIKKFITLGLDNVHGEDVTVPSWIRNRESAHLLAPIAKTLPILGLGGSVGTPKDGITAGAVVVRTFDEFNSLPDAHVSGKIVVFVPDYIDYPSTAKYRVQGASAAAKKGAVAVLIRSVTDFSINTPHTGQQDYDQGVNRIPAACVTVEDAEMLLRMYERGQHIVITLKMEAENRPAKISRNVIADIRGGMAPEKMVIVSGHIDSWDVGQGAMDDGGGAFVSWMSLHLLKAIGYRPKRTLRSILFTSEEPGLHGAYAYRSRHLMEESNINILMESDEGLFKPQGLILDGSTTASCIIHQILQLLQHIQATTLKIDTKITPDLDIWQNTTIPRATILTQNDKYFWFHHTEGDTVKVFDKDELDDCLIVWAATSYILADLSIDLPRM